MRFNIISIDEFGMTKLELSSILKNMSVHIIGVRDEIEAENILDEGKFDINAIIKTVNSLDFRDFDSVRKLKSKNSYKHIPLVIVSKLTDKKYIIKAIESGAVEYIAKPYDEGTVSKKLCRILGVPFDKNPDNKLDDDIVTFSFSEMFNKEVKAASRGGHALSLMLVSIIPNSCDMGNQEDIYKTLDLFNKVIRTNLRETDTTFHYSSNNLMLLLPFADKEGALIVEGKIRSIFKNHTMIMKRNKNYNFVAASVSFPEDGKVKERLLEKLEISFDEIVKLNSSIQE